MTASRTRALGARHSSHFWLGAFCVALMPAAIGYQDIAGMSARQPAAPHHTHRHLIASPFGTIEPATFSYGHRPIGTAMPRWPDIVVVNFDPRSITGTTGSDDQLLAAELTVQDANPAINRDLKGDRLASAEIAGASLAAEPAQPVAVAAPQAAPATTGTIARVDIDLPAEIPPAGQIETSESQQSLLAPFSLAQASAEERSGQTLFGPRLTLVSDGLQRWTPGAAPIIATSSFEPGVKFAALEEAAEDDANGDGASDKDAAQLQSPAQRLGLAGKERAHAEKCLTNAVYFEARGEPLRGQEAVAQVVMNRVFSGYYPNNVCGVVYQNAGRYLGCQFTFACEHKNLDRIDEPDMWEQAKHIAKDTLDGKIWLTDIGHATHYHAYWVRPSWVHEMTKLYKLGVHTFYRPRAWGNGSYEPVWGTAPNKNEDGGAKPQAEAAPDRPVGKDETTAKL
jgi:spore germination cell wall hydrolase CwlJ-like protein